MQRQRLNQVIELIEKGGLESILTQEILRVSVTTWAENDRILPFSERLFIAPRSQFDQNDNVVITFRRRMERVNAFVFPEPMEFAMNEVL